MTRCVHTKPGGERCGATAMKGYATCYGHREDLAEERRRNASRGGKAGGRGRAGPGEMKEIKGNIRSVIHGVLSGRIERGVGAVLFQGHNTLLKAVELERKVREQDELEERLRALERASGERGAGQWGA